MRREFSQPKERNWKSSGCCKFSIIYFPEVYKRLFLMDVPLSSVYFYKVYKSSPTSLHLCSRQQIKKFNERKVNSKQYEYFVHSFSVHKLKYCMLRPLKSFSWIFYIFDAPNHFVILLVLTKYRYDVAHFLHLPKKFKYFY